MKITFYETTKQQAIWFKQKLAKHKIQFKSGYLSSDNLPSLDTEVLCVSAHSLVGKNELKAMPSLQLIITRTAGTDHIDLAACRRANVRVVNCPGLNAVSVAEFTFGLLLAYMRKLPTSLQQGKQLNYQVNLIGNELAGKTIGIVGTGAIGSRVAVIAHAFGMNIFAYDAKKNVSLMKLVPVRYLGLKQLVSRSDIISLHVPATPLTDKLINKELLSRFKQKSILINTARGSVVDARAVLNALTSGKLDAYITDVLEQESILGSSKSHYSTKNKNNVVLQKSLAKHPKVWLTPHLAHATLESEQRILEQTLRLIIDFYNRKKLPFVI